MLWVTAWGEEVREAGLGRASWSGPEVSCSHAGRVLGLYINASVQTSRWKQLAPGKGMSSVRKFPSLEDKRSWIQFRRNLSLHLSNQQS